ncbi:Uncharacterized protein ToN1_50170 [Aromatoleum petrolei]|nr:Uncharacterized protein ToN1_50170 [Aromatoleum petrolei]
MYPSGAHGRPRQARAVRARGTANPDRQAAATPPRGRSAESRLSAALSGPVRCGR